MKRIFITMVWSEDLFDRGKGQLGNGIFQEAIKKVHFTVQRFTVCFLLQITPREAQKNSKRYGRAKCLSNADML